jgi:AcrR family transcriptional regulator
MDDLEHVTMAMRRANQYVGIGKLHMPPQVLQKTEAKGRGRTRSAEAEASVLKAALCLLEKKSLRQVTTDAIALRAGVSKATIYKWWPNKRLVALDAFLGGMNERVAMPDTGSALEDFATQLTSVMLFYKSPLGKLFGQFIAEGQSDLGFLALFREKFLFARRDAARVMWQRGVLRGDICKDLDSEIVLDLIYGPMIFRLLAGHGSLAEHDSRIMVEAVFVGIGTTKSRRIVHSKATDARANAIPVV